MKLTLQDVTSPILLPHVLSFSSLCWIQMVQHLPLSVRIREFHGKQFLVVPGNCFHLRNEFFVSIVQGTSMAGNPRETMREEKEDPQASRCCLSIASHCSLYIVLAILGSEGVGAELVNRRATNTVPANCPSTALPPLPGLGRCQKAQRASCKGAFCGISLR